MNKYLIPLTLSLFFALLLTACSHDNIVGDSITYEDISSSIIASDSNSDTTINLSWGEVLGAEGYNLTRSTDPVDSSFEVVLENYEGNSFTDLDILVNTKYWYKVQAVFSSIENGSYSDIEDGIARSSLASATFPTSLAVDASDGTFGDKVEINWTDCGAAALYDIYASSYYDSAYTLLESGYTTPSFSHTTAVPGEYFYKVIALSGVDSAKGLDEGYRNITAKEFFVEVNKTFKYSQDKLELLESKGTESLGTEEEGGDIHGTINYDAAMDGLNVDIEIMYTNYRDFYLTLNGYQSTRINGLVKQSGDVNDVVTVTGLYSGSIDHHIDVSGGVPTGGHYTVTVDGVGTSDVQFSDVKEFF